MGTGALQSQLRQGILAHSQWPVMRRQPCRGLPRLIWVLPQLPLPGDFRSGEFNLPHGSAGVDLWGVRLDERDDVHLHTVQAITGAGWSAASDPSNSVTPLTPAHATIMITETRKGRRSRSRARRRAWLEVTWLRRGRRVPVHPGCVVGRFPSRWTAVLRGLVAREQGRGGSTSRPRMLARTP